MPRTVRVYFNYWDFEDLEAKNERKAKELAHHTAKNGTRIDNGDGSWDFYGPHQIWKIEVLPETTT